MYKLLNFALFLVFTLACACNNDKTVAQPTTPVAPAAVAKPDLKGAWISVDYLDQLKKTNSLRDAQGACELCGIIISDSAMVSTNWNWHEGGDLQLKDQNGVRSIEAEGSDIKYSLDASAWPILQLNGKSYSKIEHMENGPNQLIAGKYLLKGQPVVFTENGQCSGLGDFKYYSAVPDYITDQGKGDRIMLSKVNLDDAPGIFYAVSKTADQLVISDLKCILKEGGDCIADIPNKVIYQLTVQR
jgi:hypothetical protein